jgi:hypothetical protein
MKTFKTMLVIILSAFALVGCIGTSTGTRIFPAYERYGPGISVPQIYMTENGDRVGHYAPYFYPDH